MKKIPKSLTIFKITFVLDESLRDYDFKYYYLAPNFGRIKINKLINLVCFDSDTIRVYADIDESFSKKEIEKEIEEAILDKLNFPISFFEEIIKRKMVDILK